MTMTKDSSQFCLTLRYNGKIIANFYYNNLWYNGVKLIKLSKEEVCKLYQKLERGY